MRRDVLVAVSYAGHRSRAKKDDCAALVRHGRPDRRDSSLSRDFTSECASQNSASTAKNFVFDGRVRPLAQIKAARVTLSGEIVRCRSERAT
jgi:hypothetical protein